MGTCQRFDVDNLEKQGQTAGSYNIVIILFIFCQIMIVIQQNCKKILVVELETVTIFITCWKMILDIKTERNKK